MAPKAQRDRQDRQILDLTETVADLLNRVEDLEADRRSLVDENRQLWDQLSEQNLRILYAMQHILLERKSASSIIVGAEQPPVRKPLYEWYMHERAEFLERLQRSVLDARQHPTGPEGPHGIAGEAGEPGDRVGDRQDDADASTVARLIRRPDLGPKSH